MLLTTVEELVEELKLCRGKACKEDENVGESFHDEDNYGFEEQELIRIEVVN